MSVNPSPIGGYAGQFFDNNGQPLSGGKIYTYAAGTTTPQATYTSATGVTPHSNPIVLDSAGRVPGGEIWLTDGLVYKFVIETSTAILIGTYDNITGVNSNFVNYAVQEEIQTATAGQTVFNLTTINYQPGTNSLSVFIDGVNQYLGGSYLETDSDTVTFTSGLHVGAEVKFTTAVTLSSGTTTADLVVYAPPFTGASATNVEDKLAQYVSVKDFGAVGNGITDDTAAFQAAFSSGEYGIFVPNGTYIVDSVTGSDIYLFGSGTIKKKAATKDEMIYLTGSNVIEGVTFDYDWTNAAQTLPYFANISLRQDQGVITVRNCKFVRSFARALYVEGATLTLSGSSFSEGAPHNNQSGGNERVTSYVDIQADLLTDEQFVEITGNSFVGTSLVTANLHLNPTGIFINAQALDGIRYKSVNIVGNTLIACSQNAGAGNVTGAIDTYDGVENLVISGNTIRLFSYAGIKVQNSGNVSITGNTVTEGAAPVGAAVDHSNGIILAEKVRSAVTEQYNGVIANNIVTDCRYTGIYNNIDNVSITGNVVNNVTKNVVGSAIYNEGSFVTIMSNVCQNIEGIMIYTNNADRVKIIGNDLDAGQVATDAGIFFYNTDIIIIGNTVFSNSGSSSSGIRTNAASNCTISGNRINGYLYGVDIRDAPGPTTAIDVGVNIVTNNGTSSLTNITAGVTNSSQARRTMPAMQFIYDAPSLAPGVSDTVQTLTLTGAAVGDAVNISGSTDTKGLIMNAWVSAADTISYFLSNPTGNPNGTVDLNSAVWVVTVTKKIQT